MFQSLGATIGLSVFGSLLSKDIKGGIEGLKDQLPAGTVIENIETGGIPSGIGSELLTKVQMAFVHAFQHIFSISLIFVVVAFLICWFLKKEVLTKKADDAVENAA